VGRRRTGVARFMQSRITEVFAIDIHPAARVGRGVFIDMRLAFVVGQTSVIEDDVSMLQSVTLGAPARKSAIVIPRSDAA
jgi:serine O-acetyltransferase